jgi:hypothetical protein
MERLTRIALLAFLIAVLSAPAAAAETVPPTDIATGAATAAETSAEVLGYFNYGTTMPPGIPDHCWFEYGTTLAYGAREDAICSGTTKATLSQLIPGTTYHYRAAASNSAGTSYGPDKVVTTLGSPPPPVDTSPFAPDVSLTVASGQSLTSVLRRGLRLRLKIAGACPCTVRARLVVSRATARRFGIAGSTSIALTRTRYDSAQTATLKLKLKSRAKRKLRSARRLKATMRVTLTGASGTRDVASRSLRLKRGRIGFGS